MILVRRPITMHGARLLVTPLILTGVALAATGVGWLLLTLPIAGAIIFTGGMFLSVWLRNFGERGRTAGALIALPLIAMLIVPPPIGPAAGGPSAHLLLVLIAGLIAFAFAAIVQQLSRAAGLRLADEAREASANATARAESGTSSLAGVTAAAGVRGTAPGADAGAATGAGGRSAPSVAAEGPTAVAGVPGAVTVTAFAAGATERPKRAPLSVATRMAIQLAAALVAAFAVGFAFYPAHWGWAVLTAFIVCSGARGRGDAAYKGVLRLFGAFAGTIAAALLTHLWLPTGVGEAVAIFAALYVGLWLRDINYAYWAACITLVLALLASNATLGIGLLELRLQAILVGAICAVAATWFVFPIRTEAVIRRRLADALRAFDDLLVHGASSDAERSARLAYFEHHLKELDQVAPPVRWHRRLLVRGHAPNHPARWIDLAGQLRPHAHAFPSEIPAKGSTHGAIRKALGISRRAIGQHGKSDAPPDAKPIGAALDDLHAILAKARKRANH